MKFRCFGLAATLLGIVATAASAATPLATRKTEIADPAPIPWKDLADTCRATVKSVVDKSVLTAHGPAETFACDGSQYAWFLDHPDRAVVAWRRLGARCTSITPRPNGKFAWTDDLGSEVVWDTIHRGDGLRIWYAEGKVRPGPVLPLVPVKAVVVLNHTLKQSADGSATVRHQAELFVHTDSKTANALTKMMGSNARTVAEQGMAQLQLFFSGISWYIERHPEHADALLRPDDRATSALATSPR